MALRFLGGDTGGGGSPRLYRIDDDDYVVQGYVVTEPALLAELSLPEGETAVRVPCSIWKYLPAEPDHPGIGGRDKEDTSERSSGSD